MGARYSIDGSQTVSNPTKSALGLTSGTVVRPRIYDVIVGQGGTAADNISSNTFSSGTLIRAQRLR